MSSGACCKKLSKNSFPYLSMTASKFSDLRNQLIDLCNTINSSPKHIHQSLLLLCHVLRKQLTIRRIHLKQPRIKNVGGSVFNGFNFRPAALDELNLPRSQGSTLKEKYSQH
jgi:hypothetical protein